VLASPIGRISYNKSIAIRLYLEQPKRRFDFKTTKGNFNSATVHLLTLAEKHAIVTI